MLITPTSHAEELRFWQAWLDSRGGAWPQEFRERLDPSLALHWEHCAALGTPEGGTALILDVGAGPLTSLGKVWPGRTVNITAVDPLATAYGLLLDERGIVPPVRTRPGNAATLSAEFGRDAFDMVHARNAIDHTEDALVAVREMLAVTRPGGCVYLSHARNEGASQGYSGMHSWNFDGEVSPDGGARFIAWNSRGRVDVTGALAADAATEVRLLPGWINVVMRKHRGETA